MDLDEFVKQHKCAICGAPDEIIFAVNQGLAKGHGHTLIARWLREEHGMNIVQSTVQNHHANPGGRHDQRTS